MRTEALRSVIDSISPEELREAWDNTGWQIDTGREVDTVLVALEVTEDVIQEAIKKGAELIVTHHPLLFAPLSSVRLDETAGRYIDSLLRRGISVYSTHTSFDKVEGGNNSYIGCLIAAKRVSVVPGTMDMMRVGDLEKPLKTSALTRLIAERFEADINGFRLTGDPARLISRAAWCSGAGGGLTERAKSCGAQLYITGDLGYHEARQAAESGIDVLDIGHFASEEIFVRNMAAKLREKLPGSVKVIRSSADRDPFTCYGRDITEK